MKDQRIEIRCHQSFLKAVDDWRKKQPEIPSRAAAIRQLTLKGIQYDA